MGVIKDVQTIFLNFLHKEKLSKRTNLFNLSISWRFTGQLFIEKLEQGFTYVTEQVNSWFYCGSAISNDSLVLTND